MVPPSLERHGTRFGARVSLWCVYFRCKSSPLFRLCRVTCAPLCDVFLADPYLKKCILAGGFFSSFPLYFVFTTSYPELPERVFFICPRLSCSPPQVKSFFCSFTAYFFFLSHTGAFSPWLASRMPAISSLEAPFPLLPFDTSPVLPDFVCRFHIAHLFPFRYHFSLTVFPPYPGVKLGPPAT